MFPSYQLNEDAISPEIYIPIQWNTSQCSMIIILCMKEVYQSRPSVASLDPLGSREVKSCMDERWNLFLKLVNFCIPYTSPFIMSLLMSLVLRVDVNCLKCCNKGSLDGCQYGESIPCELRSLSHLHSPRFKLVYPFCDHLTEYKRHVTLGCLITSLMSQVFSRCH